MQVLFTARHANIDNDLKEYCQERLHKLARYVEEPAIMEVRFEDIRGGQKAGEDNLVCITVNQPHQRNPFHIEKTTGDYRASFDIARDHLENHLHRQHTKTKIKKHLHRFDKLLFWKK